MRKSLKLCLIFSVLFQLGLCGSALAAKGSVEYVAALDGGLAVRVQLVSPDPDQPVRGDILYLHGFADRADNHMELFNKWANAGFRVLAFDFPEHGQTSGPANDLDKIGFIDLAKIASKVESKLREDPDRPLFLAGWSTGGLLAVRMVQSKNFPQLGRPIAGMVLYAPGVAVRPLVGKFGIVTKDTLTRNPKPGFAGPISPRSPLLRPVFAAKLVANSLLAQAEPFPSDIPTLVFMGGEKEDKYVDTDKVERWIGVQIAKNGANMVEVKIPDAFHALDKEPSPDGDAVRDISAVFTQNIVEGHTKVSELKLPNLCEKLLLATGENQ